MLSRSWRYPEQAILVKVLDSAYISYNRPLLLNSVWTYFLIYSRELKMLGRGIRLFCNLFKRARCMLLIKVHGLERLWPEGAGYAGLLLMLIYSKGSSGSSHHWE